MFTDQHWLVLSWQENADLFKADLSSRIWRDYVRYLDRIVLDGLCALVHKSLELLLTNMEPDVGPGVLAAGVPVLGSRCPPVHGHFGQWPNVTVPMLPAACRAVGLWDVKPHSRHCPVSGPGVPAVRGADGAVGGPGAVPALPGGGEW